MWIHLVLGWHGCSLRTSLYTLWSECRRILGLQAVCMEGGGREGGVCVFILSFLEAAWEKWQSLSSYSPQENLGCEYGQIKIGLHLYIYIYIFYNVMYFNSSTLILGHTGLCGNVRSSSAYCSVNLSGHYLEYTRNDFSYHMLYLWYPTIVVSTLIHNRTNWPWYARTRRIFLATRSQSSLYGVERASPASHWSLQRSATPLANLLKSTFGSRAPKYLILACTRTNSFVGVPCEQD